MVDFVEEAHILLLVIGGFLFLNPKLFALKRSSRAYIINTILLVVVALTSLYVYVNFGDFHNYGIYGHHSYHYSEMYHYFIGGKYYKELGYDKLYNCTYVALRELGSDGVVVPQINDIRLLSNPSLSKPSQLIYAENYSACHQAFTPKRWLAFKQDIATHVSMGLDDVWWQGMLFDVGFNATPAWNIIGNILANAVPYTPTTAELFPFIDIVLLFIGAGFLIWRSFGLYPLCGYFVVLGNNFLSTFTWTLGSYCRHFWIFFLIAALCSLKTSRFKTAGAFFALAISLRIFPIYFAIGALVPLAYMAWRNIAYRKKIYHFMFGFAVSALAVLLISTLLFGIGSWQQFLQKIIHHNSILFVYHIGYEKMVEFSPAMANQNFHSVAGLVRFDAWQEQIRAGYEANFGLHLTIKVVLTVIALYLLRRKSPYVASIVIGGLLLFLFAIPANYYYIYLVALPVVLYPHNVADYVKANIRLVATFVLLVGIHLVPIISNDPIVQNGYITRMVFFYFLVLLISFVPLGISKPNQATL